MSSRRTQPRSWGCDAGLDCEQEKTYIQVTPPLRFLRGARNRREAVSACLEGSLRTIAYVDGFNLYYRALRGTPDKWLDVRALLELVYPRNALEHVRYYTALVKPLPNDSDLVEPIRLVTRDLGLPVGVLNPCNQPAGGLRNAATFYTVMRANAPAKCQLPPQLADQRGPIHKPATW